MSKPKQHPTEVPGLILEDMHRTKHFLNASQWEAPEPKHIRAVMTMAGWSGEEFARRIDVAGRTVRRWLKGNRPIPYAAWCVLCVQAGLGGIWNARLLNTKQKEA